MKLASQWISEHVQSGNSPHVDEPVGCFTEAQIREIQWDGASASPSDIDALRREVIKDRLKKMLEETK